MQIFGDAQGRRREIGESRSLIRVGVACQEKRLLWQESERCCSPGESHYVPRGGGSPGNKNDDGDGNRDYETGQVLILNREKGQIICFQLISIQ